MDLVNHCILERQVCQSPSASRCRSQMMVKVSSKYRRLISTYERGSALIFNEFLHETSLMFGHEVEMHVSIKAFSAQSMA